MELFNANRQWAERPDDERFASLADLDAACRGYRAQSATARVPYKVLEAVGDGREVLLRNSGNGAVGQLSHWAFGQVCGRAGAPAGYLRSLPADLAAECLNTGLARRQDDELADVLVYRNGHRLIRALTSERYTRIWNSDVTRRLLALQEHGWQVPPARPARRDQAGARPATSADVLAASNVGLSVNLGDLIAPAGLYASDHDLWAFMVNEARRIAEPGNPAGLARGFFCWNSEVGAASFGVMTFLYRHVCGNHIVWGAKDVKELRVRHVGDADDRAFRDLTVELRRYADEAAARDEARIRQAQTYKLGATKDEVLDLIFGLKVPGITRDLARQAVDLATVHRDTDGDPFTAWGVANGLTRASQALPYGDERVAVDRAAGRLLEVVF